MTVYQLISLLAQSCSHDAPFQSGVKLYWVPAQSTREKGHLVLSQVRPRHGISVSDNENGAMRIGNWEI